MKVAVFSAKPYDRQYFEKANQQHGHDLHFFESRLTEGSAGIAADFPAICPFVNDNLNSTVLKRLAESGTTLLALRSAGFNHIDIKEAARLGLTVARVPAYSPNAVAEHTVALILTLNRKTHRAFNRVREGNFSLDGLVGFDLCKRSIGIVGTGKIGQILARIMLEFGCRVYAYDLYPNAECAKLGVEYVSLDELFTLSDIISLNCPLTPDTHHMIDSASLEKVRDGVMLINTGRGALIDTAAVVKALKSGKIGYLGLDVYEEEGDLFFENLSEKVIQDDVFMRLLTFPNVLITGHSGFFTAESLGNIAETTLGNISAFETGKGEIHVVGPEMAT